MPSPLHYEKRKNLAHCHDCTHGCSFSNCQSASAKRIAEVKATEEHAINNQKLVEQTQKTALKREWTTFKDKSELELAFKEVRIWEYRHNMAITALQDTLLENELNIVERKCIDLKGRITAYEKDRSNLQVFKRSFDFDMEQIDSSFKLLTVAKE